MIRTQTCTTGDGGVFDDYDDTDTPTVASTGATAPDPVVEESPPPIPDHDPSVSETPDETGTHLLFWGMTLRVHLPWPS